MSQTRGRGGLGKPAKSGGSNARILKVILLGDGGVGKSSLMNVFVHGRFDDQSFHTIGVEFLIKDIVIDGETYALQIWDTAGQERFKSLRTPFYRGADCCLLTFALNDQESFQNLALWRREFLYYADVSDGSTFPFIVLGNKCDLVAEASESRVVTDEEAREWCSQNGNVPYYETSAKDTVNVDVAFEAVARRVRELEKEGDAAIRKIRPDTVDLSGKRGGTNGSPESQCC